MSQQRLVVSLCDKTGNMVRPWVEAGYDCICFDLQHPISGEQVRGGITYRWGDVRSLTPSDIWGTPAIVFAFPPCTHLSVSGARWFARKGLRQFIDALELVESCRLFCEWFGCPWMIENPVSRLSTAWRKPDHMFDPCDYGDPWVKKTCLWTGNGFVMPPRRPVDPTEGQKLHRLPPSPDRADLRSETPPGFARAVFEANHPQIVRAEAGRRAGASESKAERAERG